MEKNIGESANLDTNKEELVEELSGTTGAGEWLWLLIKQKEKKPVEEANITAQKAQKLYKNIE